MSSSRDPSDIPRFRVPWFWWSVAICLAACFAVLSWTLSDVIFSRPEKAENYEILRKLNRIPAPPEFKGSTAPSGVTLEPIPLYSRFLSVSPEDRVELNTVLKRQFVSGFSEQDLIFYVEGDFQILEIRDLTENDFVTEGLIVKAQASIRPEGARNASLFPLILEYILPGAKSKQKVLYKKGEIIRLKKAPSYCVVLHASDEGTADEPFAVVTAMPIVKGAQVTPDKQRISTSLPESYNVTAPLPLLEYP